MQSISFCWQRSTCGRLPKVLRHLQNGKNRRGEVLRFCQGEKGSGGWCKKISVLSPNKVERLCEKLWMKIDVTNLRTNMLPWTAFWMFTKHYLFFILDIHSILWEAIPAMQWLVRSTNQPEPSVKDSWAQWGRRTGENLGQSADNLILQHAS